MGYFIGKGILGIYLLGRVVWLCVLFLLGWFLVIWFWIFKDKKVGLLIIVVL